MDSVAPAAAISWRVGNSNRSVTHVSDVKELDDGLVSARSSVHLLSSLYSGQDLTCVVEHPSLKAPEKRTTRIPAQSVFFPSIELFPLCHTRKPDQQLLSCSRHPHVVFYRSPCAECVRGEKAGLSPLAGSV